MTAILALLDGAAITFTELTLILAGAGALTCLCLADILREK